MRCLMWVWSLIYIPLLSLQCRWWYHDKLDRVITALDSMYQVSKWLFVLLWSKLRPVRAVCCKLSTVSLPWFSLLLGNLPHTFAVFTKIIGHIRHFRWLGPNVWWEISQIWIEYIKPVGQMSDESWNNSTTTDHFNNWFLPFIHNHSTIKHLHIYTNKMSDDT